MDDDYEMFKIVVIGSTGTGKTNIATRYIRNQFNEGQKATVGVQFLSKIVQVRSQNIKVTLWDTAGQERYKSLSKVYYKGATGVLIVYDVTQPQTYIDVQSWLRLANQNLNLNQVVLMIVGNKVDLQNEIKVPKERVLREYKQKFDIDCWEVSAKTGFNVRQVFTQLLQKIYEKNMQNREEGEGDQYRDSIEPSLVVASSKQAPTKPSTVTQTKDQSTIKVSNIMKNPQTNVVPKSAPKSQPKKSQPEPKPAPPKVQKKIVLNSADEKRREKQSKQKKKGCC